MKTKREKPTLNADIADMEAFFEENENDTPQVERFNALSPQDKRILLVYLHYGHYKETAKHFKCSPSWMGKRIRKILNEIK